VAAAVAGTLTFGVSSGIAASPLTDYTTNFTRVASPDPQPGGRWSERLATVPDLNGDGVNEILVGDPNESFGGFTTAGRVYMQEGATRQIMYSIDSPEIQSGVKFGFFISAIGDVNGDGKADFAVGTDGQNTDATTGASCTPAAGSTCNVRAGKAWVFEGADGHMLYPLTPPAADRQAGARFGSRIGRAGDVGSVASPGTPDGTQDIIVGASGTDNPPGCAHVPGGTDGPSSTIKATGTCRNGEGAAYIFNGKDGTLIRKLNLPATDVAPAPCNSSCGGFGLAVQGPGDVGSAANGPQDGVVDQLVDASSFNFDTKTRNACTAATLPADCNKTQGAEYLFSGKDGTLIRRTDDPVPQAKATFGFQDAEPLAPGDVNGDGVPDYYANGFGQDGPPEAGLPAGNNAGRAWVFSGKTGAVLYELKDPTPENGGQFAFSLSRTDYNKDGTPDPVVGQAPHDPSTGAAFDQSGGIYVFNGKDGSLLKSLELPASDAQPGASGNNGSNLGFTSISPGDLNHDGEPDFVGGAPFQDVDPTGALPQNCQAPTPGCIQDVGREFFFYSNVPGSPPGPGTTPPGTTPPGTVPPRGPKRPAARGPHASQGPAVERTGSGAIFVSVTCVSSKSGFCVGIEAIKFRKHGLATLRKRFRIPVGRTSNVLLSAKKSERRRIRFTLRLRAIQVLQDVGEPDQHKNTVLKGRRHGKA